MTLHQNKRYGGQLLYKSYKSSYFFKITHSLLILIGISSLFLISCSETPQQYDQPSSVDDTDTVEHLITPVLATEATHPDGGYLLYQKQMALLHIGVKKKQFSCLNCLLQDLWYSHHIQ